MSDSPFNLPDNAPFGHQQKVALNALLPSLNAQQAAWLSGYFAALGSSLAPGGKTASPAQAQASAPQAQATVPTVPLTVLFGSESGNSEECADIARDAAKAAGFKAEAIDMGDYDYSKLENEENVLVIVSTWGEGDPPERAVPFHEFVHSDSAPNLKEMNYSVCALGDTSYADFCECGKEFDKRFEELGANRVHERVDCDVDFEDPFESWLREVMPKMVEKAGVKEAVAEAVPAAASSGPEIQIPDFAPPFEDSSYGKKNPFPSELKKRINLNGKGSAKETIHLEFNLEGSGMSYDPGDALAVIPSNCPQVVDDMLRLAGFRGDELREEEDGLFSLAEVLENRFDVTSLNANIIKKYAPFAKNKQLERLLKDENKKEMGEYLWGREIRDLFLDFPPADAMTSDQLLGMLRKMPPRLYSIASSLKAHPDEVHLTVGVVRYKSLDMERKGVCSTYLADRIAEGETGKVYIHNNKNFFLPEDPDVPIIMIGPGTGIAPFRAFVEERDALGAKGKNWLFFGDQHFSTDFLYQTEWQDYLKKGILTQMDVAFSRDTDKKVYVQHKMKERSKEIYEWMQEGAYFYVCGDANRMAKDVNDQLIDIFATEGKMKREEAEAYVRELQKNKRYQRDVY